MYKNNSVVKFALLILISVSASCGNNTSKAPQKMTVGEPSVLEVSIDGMMCTGCEQSIQNNVSKVEGVKSVKASWKDGIAFVEYFPQITDTSKIKEAVKAAGYTFKSFKIPSDEAAQK